MDHVPPTDTLDADDSACRQAALDLLARREYARGELRLKLRRQFDVESVDRALQGLAAAGLQCDHRYACSYARARVRRGYGPLRIRGELLQRGLSGEIVDDALTLSAAQENWRWGELARRALRQKFGDASLPREYAQRAKALRFLQNRGFPLRLVGGDEERVSEWC